MLCLCRSKRGLHMVVLKLPQQNLQRLVSAAGARLIACANGRGRREMPTMNIGDASCRQSMSRLKPRRTRAALIILKLQKLHDPPINCFNLHRPYLEKTPPPLRHIKTAARGSFGRMLAGTLRLCCANYNDLVPNCGCFP